jgi:hypothetical protein
VFSGGQLITETKVFLSFYNWLLIMPENFSPLTTTYALNDSFTGISGDNLSIQSGCDIDSIVVSWSSLTGVTDDLQRQNLLIYEPP